MRKLEQLSQVKNRKDKGVPSPSSKKERNPHEQVSIEHRGITPPPKKK